MKLNAFSHAMTATVITHLGAADYCHDRGQRRHEKKQHDRANAEAE